SRCARSASVHNRLMPARSSVARLSTLCAEYTHGSESASKSKEVIFFCGNSKRVCLGNIYVFDDYSRAIVHAKTERRGVLHVTGLADDDVDVRIGVARARVVHPKRAGRAVQVRDRAGRAASLFGKT